MIPGNYKESKNCNKCSRYTHDPIYGGHPFLTKTPLGKLFSPKIKTLTKESYPIYACSSQTKPPEYFGDISLIRTIHGKYLKESCSLKLHL